MRNPIIVGIADFKVGKDPDVIVTYALGSCVGICLYDNKMKIGGLSHIMLPNSKMFKKTSINRMKFADTAIPDLARAMVKKGADRKRITAKIAGGAKMFNVAETESRLGTIGRRNIESVKAILRSLKIPIIGEDVEANYGRTVYFDTSTGIMKVDSLNKTIKEL